MGDGYFLMLAPLPKGEHTIHYGGTFRFTLEEDGFEAEFPSPAGLIAGGAIICNLPMVFL